MYDLSLKTKLASVFVDSSVTSVQLINLGPVQLMLAATLSHVLLFPSASLEAKSQTNRPTGFMDGVPWKLNVSVQRCHGAGASLQQRFEASSQGRPPIAAGAAVSSHDIVVLLATEDGYVAMYKLIEEPSETPIAPPHFVLSTNTYFPRLLWEEQLEVVVPRVFVGQSATHEGGLGMRDHTDP